jgi:hypothetical protein
MVVNNENKRQAGTATIRRPKEQCVQVMGYPGFTKIGARTPSPIHSSGRIAVRATEPTKKSPQ